MGQGYSHPPPLIEINGPKSQVLVPAGSAFTFHPPTAPHQFRTYHHDSHSRLHPHYHHSYPDFHHRPLHRHSPSPPTEWFPGHRHHHPYRGIGGGGGGFGYHSRSLSPDFLPHYPSSDFSGDLEDRFGGRGFDRRRLRGRKYRKAHLGIPVGGFERRGGSDISEDSGLEMRRGYSGCGGGGGRFKRKMGRAGTEMGIGDYGSVNGNGMIGGGGYSPMGMRPPQMGMGMPGGGMGFNPGMNGMMGQGTPAPGMATMNGLGSRPPYAMAGYPSMQTLGFQGIDPQTAGGGALGMQQTTPLVPPQRPATVPHAAAAAAAANMSHIPAGAFAPGIPQPPIRPRTEPAPPKQTYKPEVKHKTSNEEGNEWIRGHPFLDACICTTNCTCRQGHRVLYREENGDGERASGEIRYVLKDQLGKDCGDHSKCAATSAVDNDSDTSGGGRAEKEYKAARREAKKGMRRMEEGMQDIMERLERLDMKQAATPPNTIGTGIGLGPTATAPPLRLSPPIPGMPNPYAVNDPVIPPAQIDPRQMPAQVGLPRLPGPAFGPGLGSGIGPGMGPMLGPGMGAGIGSGPNPRRSLPQHMDPRMMGQMGSLPPSFEDGDSAMGEFGMDMMDPSMPMVMGMGMRGMGRSHPPRPEMFDGGLPRRRSGRGMPPDMMMDPFGRHGPPMGRGGRRQHRGGHRGGPGPGSGPGSRRRRPEFSPEDELYMRGGRTGHDFANDNDSQWEDTGFDDNDVDDGPEWRNHREAQPGRERVGRQGLSRQSEKRGGTGRGRQAHVEDDDE